MGHPLEQIFTLSVFFVSLSLAVRAPQLQPCIDNKNKNKYTSLASQNRVKIKKTDGRAHLAVPPGLIQA